MEVVLLLLVILVIIYIGFAIKIIKQSESVVVERLGKYNRTIYSGVHVIWPILETAKSIEWRYVQQNWEGKKQVIRRSLNRIDLRETVYNFPKQNVITRDNVVIEIDAVLYFQVTDPVKSVYEIANLPDAIETLTQTTLRNVIGEMDLDHTLSSRDTINSKLKTILDEAGYKWGLKVNRVELQEISPPDDIKQAMEKQMRAERDKRASILEAEGKKQSNILESEGQKLSEINKAEGEKKARVLLAEGEAEAKIKVAQAEAESMKIITESIQKGSGNPVNYLVAIKYIEAMKEMVSGKDNKAVYIPYEATGILGSVGGIKELFK